ncbi:hypothetical protein [Streptomyces hydrogenans]|uniref:hypothetical protein n=1 Tax=Streptomyces hydrogenans TaxID=1873719 RepID=UPI0037F92475
MSVYRATRGDKKKLFKLPAGTRLYVINEHTPYTDSRHPGIQAGNTRSYSEWIVTTKRMPFTGNPIVQSPNHGGEMSLETLLSQEREIHTAKPNLPLRGAPYRQDDYSDDRRSAERLVADLHEESMKSDAMSRKWAMAGRR